MSATPLPPAIWHQAALEAGFAAAAATRPELPGEASLAFSNWLARGFPAELAWLSRTAQVRQDPRLFHPAARSVLVVAVDTFGPPLLLAGGGRVARFAQGQDYHRLLRKRARRLAAGLARRLGRESLPYRFAVDAHPVLERALASQAGLGWIGRQAQLIHPTFGPWLLLGELFLEVELEPIRAGAGSCGRCGACLEACPTGALVAPGLVDARRCLSFWTVEARGLPPRELRPLLGDRLFGCDSCLEACPWRRLPPRTDPDLAPRANLSGLSLEECLGEPTGRAAGALAGSNLKRTGRDGLARNAALVAANLERTDLAPLLAARLQDPAPVVRAAAVHALRALGRGGASLAAARRSEADPLVRSELDSP